MQQKLFKEEIQLGVVQEMITEECDSIKELLLQKNAMYGNSVVCPRRIFSNADPVEQVKVRLDDKLSRIANMGTDPDKLEDSVRDMIGYLILLRIAQKMHR